MHPLLMAVDLGLGLGGSQSSCHIRSVTGRANAASFSFHFLFHSRNHSYFGHVELPQLWDAQELSAPAPLG